jgi:hypothetical protein
LNNLDYALILAGAVVALAGKIIFDWLKGRNGYAIHDLLIKLENDLTVLKEIHSRVDESTGRPLCHFPRNAMASLNTIRDETHAILKSSEELLKEIKRLNENIISIVKDIYKEVYRGK